MRQCNQSTCRSKHYAKGMCSKHYRQQWDAVNRPGKKMSELDRFWDKVGKTDVCWEWTGALNKEGYGTFTPTGKQTMGAHRYSYEINTGPLLAGMSIHHKCRNRRCVNPAHLAQVTETANTIEALAYKADHFSCLSFNDVDALIRHVRR